MKILVLAPHPFLQDRGTPIAVKLLVEVLAGDGHAVDILTYHEGKDVTIPGTRIHRIPSLPGIRGVRPGPSIKKIPCDVALFFRCVALVRRNRYQIIHAVEESAFIAAVMRTLFGIPYVYDMDSSLSKQMLEKYRWARPLKGFLESSEKVAIRRSLGVVAVCKSLEDDTRRHDPEKRILRLEDISLLDREGGAADASRIDPGLPAPFALYVGNLEGYQGIDLLLDAFRVAARRLSRGNLIIVGGNKRHIAHYRSRCAEMGVGDRVSFVGPRPLSELGAWLSRADILVSPRIHGENTPMKIYSYLDAGKPILATNITTHTQVLDDRIAHLVSPEPEALAEGLVRLFEDRSFASALGREAKRKASMEFTFDAFKRKLTGFYRDIERDLGGRPAVLTRNSNSRRPSSGDPC